MFAPETVEKRTQLFILLIYIINIGDINMVLLYELIAAGAVGGLIKSLMEASGRVILPSIQKVNDPITKETTRYVHLGFVTNIILGGSVGAYLSPDLVGAFTAGLTSAFVLEKMMETRPQLVESLITTPK